MGLADQLLDYARELQSATTFSQLLELTKQRLAEIGYPHAWLMLADDDDPGHLRLVDFVGAKSRDAWATSSRVRIAGTALLEEIVTATGPVVAVDARSDPRTNKQLGAALGIRTLIAVPLHLTTRAVGALGTGTFGDEGVRAPSEEDLALLTGLARQLGPAVDRVRELAKREVPTNSAESDDKFEVRRQLFAAIPRWFAQLSPDLRSLLHMIVDTAGEQLADVATLQLVEGDRTVAMAAVHAKDPAVRDRMLATMHRVPIDHNTGISGRALATRTPQRVERIPREHLLASIPDGELREIIAALDVASVIAVPLVSRDHLLGVLSMSRSSLRPAFTSEDLQLMSEFSDRAAIAVENALLFAELEVRVADRTRDLVAANRDLEAFSYSVAHDLRAPLRALGHFAVALHEDYARVLDERGLDYVRRISKAAEQMTTIIDALLSLARMTRKEISREPIDLAAIATTVIDGLRDAQPDRPVEVRIASGMSASADAALVRALYENLLGNAWKFTRGRTPAQIEVGSELRDGERVFFVRDNGAGFETALVEKLFAPFQRLHSAHDFEGSGIGLATALKIVQRHGGRIWAEGAVGQGATLRFTLPASPSPQAL